MISLPHYGKIKLWFVWVAERSYKYMLYIMDVILDTHEIDTPSLFKWFNMVNDIAALKGKKRSENTYSICGKSLTSDF